MRTLLLMITAFSFTGAAQAAPLFTASADQPSATVKAFSTPALAVTQSLIPFGSGVLGANIGAARNADGSTTLVIGAGPGGGAQVKAINPTNGTVLQNFFAFDPAFLGGVRVAAGDVTGDGVADIAVGAQSGSSAVKIFDGSSGSEIRSFMAFSPSFLGGVSLALGDVTGDGRADIIVGAGAGGTPIVTIYDGGTGLTVGSFIAFSPFFTGGVSVAFGHNTSGNTLIVGQLDGGSQVRVFDAASFAVESAFLAFDPTYTGGVSVGAGSFGHDDSLYVGGLGNGLVHIYDADLLSGTGSFTAFAGGGTNVAGVFAAVPEPASWSMMIVGFAAVGIARRRRPSRITPFAFGRPPTADSRG
jgi:hypothetical protein